MEKGKANLADMEKRLDEIGYLKKAFPVVCGIDALPSRDATLCGKIEQFCEDLDTIPAPPARSFQDQAFSWSLRGRALQMLPADKVDRADVEGLLEAAVKLDPMLWSTWAALVESYYDHGEIIKCRQTLEYAQLFNKNNKELCKLLVQAHVPVAGEDERAILEKRLALAYQAFNMDTTDPQSWYCLATTHLRLYSATWERTHLDLALNSFAKAGNDPVVWCDDAYHINHAKAKHLTMRFGWALSGLGEASMLCPADNSLRTTLNVYGDWLAKVARAYDLFKEACAQRVIQLFDALGGAVTRELDQIPVANLHLGDNVSSFVYGKVHRYFPTSENVPQGMGTECAIVADFLGDPFVMCMSNCRFATPLREGDSALLLRPQCWDVNSTHAGQKIAFRCLSTFPSQLRINEKVPRLLPLK